MGCYDSDDGDEEDEEIGYGSRGRRFLGFMFGNVDESGDLDANYLDDDAKDHLSALAGDLGSSLNELKSTVDDAGQDFGYEKAENAVDYFDIDEEVEEESENGSLSKLPGKELDFLAGQVLVDSLVPNPTGCVSDDEDYDEVVENNDVGVRNSDLPVEEEGEGLLDKVSSPKTPLPVLCMPDGSAFLRFSELFSIADDVPLNKGEQKRQHGLVRYAGVKDRNSKSVDVCHHVVEEDEEEAFLKGTQTYSAVKHGISKSSFSHDDRDVATPMEKDANARPSLERERLSPFGSNYYPLDQQDWEDGIIWDEDCSDESYETSGPDSEPQSVMHNSSSLPFSASRFHPHLLRLESRSELDDQLHHTMKNCTKKNAGENLQQSNPVRQLVCKLPSQSGGMVDGSWLDQIIWDPDIDMPTGKPKLIVDLQDEQMLFEILDNKAAEHLKLHSRAMMVPTPPVKSINVESIELLDPKGQLYWKDVASDMHYSKLVAPQQPNSNSKKRIRNGIKICHSQPALVKKKSSAGRGISDLDSFAGDLELLLDAGECEGVGLGGDHEIKQDKPDGGKVIENKKKCALIDDDDDETAREKKKARVLGEEERLAAVSRPRFAIENEDRSVKQIAVAAQSDGSYTSQEDAVGDAEMFDNIPKGEDREVEGMKKNATTTVAGLMNKKLILCGACGQLGHMRTNKNCPKYKFGEDLQKSGKSTIPNSSGESNCKKVLTLKIKWGSSKMNRKNGPVESDYKPPIVERHPTDTNSSRDVQLEKPTVVIRLPENTDRELDTNKKPVDCSQNQRSSPELQREEDRYHKKFTIRLPKKL